MKQYKVWECKIVIAGDTELPFGFDAVPRRAAIDAIEHSDINVLECFSGWGGNLTDEEYKIVSRNDKEQTNDTQRGKENHTEL